MAISKDDAKRQWEETFRSKSGRDPYAEDYNDFETKWRHTNEFYDSSEPYSPNDPNDRPGYNDPAARRSWEGLLEETGRDLTERFKDESNGESSADQGGSGGSSGSSNDLTSQWLSYMQGRDSKLDAERAAQRQKSDQLWQMYMQRATQGTDINANDPVIRRQSDAYRANETRESRNFLDTLAERSGPYANLQGEQRLAAERVGQRTGTFEAEAIARELTAKRNEIAQALAGLAGQLTGEQEMALREQLAQYDNALRAQGLQIQKDALAQNWQQALLNNTQFYSQLGLNAEDRAAYWDAVRRGLI